MELNYARNGGCLAVALQGELDHHNASEVREKIDLQLSDHCVLHLTLDLRGVTFMDSSGIGVVLGRYKLISERGGTMQIVGATPRVERILKMAGIYKLLGGQAK